jgi:hypothetical protein
LITLEALDLHQIDRLRIVVPAASDAGGEMMPANRFDV